MEIKECIRRLKSDYPEDDKMYLTIQQFVSESHLKENEELRKQLTWIPVEKELPEIGVIVLFYFKNGTWTKGFKLTNGWKILYGTGYEFIKEIPKETHWLPIPDINNK